MERDGMDGNIWRGRRGSKAALLGAGPGKEGQPRLFKRLGNPGGRRGLYVPPSGGVGPALPCGPAALAGYPGWQDPPGPL